MRSGRGRSRGPSTGGRAGMFRWWNGAADRGAGWRDPVGNAGCGELSEGVEPGLLGGDGVFGVFDLAGVTLRLGLGELGLELRDLGFELGGESLRSRLLLGVALVPVLFVEFADVRLDLAEPVF